MRVFGDNSDGFQNEIDIEKSLNEKTYDKLNANLRHFLEDIFKGYSLKGKRIHAIRSEQRVKPDFYLHIDGIPKEVYVSVKKGSGNSVHQENFSVFLDFLKKENTPQDVIDFLKLYHYSDGTRNNTGKVRLTSKEFTKEHPEVVKRLNEYFSDKALTEKLLYRFVFVGNIENAPTTDYLYHGTITSGVWASRDEIFKYLEERCKKESSAFSIGPLTYQTWNKNVNFNPNTENRREVLQLKWGSMEDDLIKITSLRDYYRQHGTYEGDIDEKSSVIYFNRNPEDIAFKKYLDLIHSKPEDTLLVRVTTNQFSKLSNQKVKTRADAYAIQILNSELFSILEENSFYLDEDILENYTDYYTFIRESGISIKLHDSEDYTLIKLTPNSFNTVFNSYALGAAASLFCKNLNELPKNKALLEGWNTNIDELKALNTYSKFTEQDLYSSLEICSNLKNGAISSIRTKIENSDSIKKLIFNGIGIYEEPYTAFFFMQSNEIFSLTYIEYTITTGSGRSKGIYSIILKPKKQEKVVENQYNPTHRLTTNFSNFNSLEDSTELIAAEPKN